MFPALAPAYSNGCPIITIQLPFLAAQIKKSWSRSGSGFSLGFVTAWCLLLSQILLLTGVELTATKHLTGTFEASPKGVWTHSCEQGSAGRGGGRRGLGWAWGGGTHVHAQWGQQPQARLLRGTGPTVLSRIEAGREDSSCSEQERVRSTCA